MCAGRANATSATYVRQAGDKDEGSRRVGPGQLEPDPAYLAEACCHLHCRGAVLDVLHGLQLYTRYTITCR